MAEKVIQMPPGDYALFQRFQAEVGEIQIPLIIEAQNAEQWYNPDLESSEMAVRGTVRGAILESLGYQDRELMEGEDLARSLDTHPDVKDALGIPNYYNYQWEKVAVKNYGPISSLKQRGDAIVDAQKGVVLFADEVQKLLAGEPVTTFHSSGLQWMGFLTERKDVFRVFDGQLQRIRGIITD